MDTGLIPIFDLTGRANLGHALETAVLVELERRRCTVTYVRTPGGYEVDFLARHPEGGSHLIQVCADGSNPETAKRELRALEEARRVHPEAKPWLLTLIREDQSAATFKGITVQPVYEWMLSDSWDTK